MKVALPTYVSQVTPEAIDTIRSKDKPEFQRSETSSKLIAGHIESAGFPLQCPAHLSSPAHSNLPIPIIDHRSGITMFGPQEGRRYIQSRRQQFSIPHKQRRAIESHQARFMEVGAERVSILIHLVEAVCFAQFW